MSEKKFSINQAFALSLICIFLFLTNCEGENSMTTKDTIQGYFNCLKQKNGKIDSFAIYFDSSPFPK